MKVVDLRVERYADRRAVADLAPGREVVVVTLTTDDGLTGTGFTNAAVLRGGSMGATTADILTQHLKPIVVGQSAMLTDQLWQRMYQSVATRVGRRGMVIGCIAAVDFALWDLKARAAGVPLSDLLGGRRERIPTYANAGHQLSPDALAQRAAEYVKAGHTAIKIRGSATAVSLDEATRRVEAVREAIGPAVKLMVDVNGTWDAETAIRQLDRWQRFDVYWLEEPVPPEDIPGYVRVRKRAGSTFIAGGEQHVGVSDFRALIGEGAIDIAQPNAAATGGITDWLRIYHLCTAFNVAVSPWNLQPIHIHMAAALPNVKWIEYFLPDNPLYDFQSRLWRGPQMREVRDATGVYLVPPEAPGLGLELDPEEADRALVKVGR
jgi:L-alanine-DL-glutamate epimerase-like enolase superfamily enzyme